MISPDGVVDSDAGGGSGAVGAGACGGCAVSGRCEGVWNAYLDLYGDAELEPVGPDASP